MYYLSMEDMKAGTLANDCIDISLWRAIKKTEILRGGRVAPSAFKIRFNEAGEAREPTASLFQNKTQNSDFCVIPIDFFNLIEGRFKIRAGGGAALVESNSIRGCEDLAGSEVIFVCDENICVNTKGLIHWALNYGVQEEEKVTHLSSLIAHCVALVFKKSDIACL